MVGEGSGCINESFDGQCIKISYQKPPAGGSYMQLPDDLRN